MNKHLEKSRNIDLSLSVLCATADEDQTLTQGEIAEFCGCSRGYIDAEERRAMKKIKRLAFFFGAFDYYDSII